MSLKKREEGSIGSMKKSDGGGVRMHASNQNSMERIRGLWWDWHHKKGKIREELRKVQRRHDALREDHVSSNNQKKGSPRKK